MLWISLILFSCADKQSASPEDADTDSNDTAFTTDDSTSDTSDTSGDTETTDEPGDESTDETTDESVPEDSDGDGYIDEEDCRPNDPDAHPGADEVCDGIDNNCDGEVDEATASDVSTWYVDLDSDGYGDEAGSLNACEQPEGYVGNMGDCNDADAAYHPWAVEDDCADPNDYNCDGSVGDIDNDKDGYVACEECDDSDSAVNPSAEEICDDKDNDCDGEIADALFYGADGSVIVSSSLSGAQTLSSAGELLICEGTWEVDFHVEADDVSIVGVNRDTVILESSESGFGIWVGDVTGFHAESLTITGGAGGVRFAGAEAVMRNFTVSNHSASGVGISHGTVLLEDFTVSGNVEERSGGGIAISAYSGDTEVTLRRGLVTGNTAENGGGIYVNDWGASVTAMEMVIHENMANNSGGGIYTVDSGRLLVMDSEITGNIAWSGGGIYADEHTETNLDGVTVEHNIATYGSGGGMRIVDSNALLSNTTIDSNQAPYDRGGGVYVGTQSTSSVLEMEGGGLSGNSAREGGGFYLYEARLVEIRDAILSGNSASAACGGGCANDSWLNLSDSVISDNSSSFGGGLIHDSGQTTVTDSDFYDNGSSDVIHMRDETHYLWGLEASFVCDQYVCD